MLKKVLIISILFGLVSYSSNSYVSKKAINQANNLFIRPYNEKKEESNSIYSYELKHKKSEDIKNIFNGMLGVKISSFENKIILEGERENVNKLIQIVSNIDINKQQIFIKANIIDTSRNLFDRLGFNWKLKESKEGSILDFLSGKISFTNLINLGGKILDVDIDALKERGDIRISASPSIVVVDGENALLKITDETLISSKISKKEETNNIFREAGLILNVTPNIKDDYIEVKIKLEISNFTSKETKKQNVIETIVNVDKRGSIFIGGANLIDKGSSISRVPILSDIPILGALFTYKTKNNIKRDVYIELEAKKI